jgi:hypothetical protein
MFRLLLQHHGPITFPDTCTAGGQNGMFGDVCFKQWVVVEILVAGKKLVTNIHKQLKECIQHQGC